jgi:diguanylate cyclase
LEVPYPQFLRSGARDRLIRATRNGPTAEEQSAPPSRAVEAQKELLERIGDFVIEHGLGVNSANLAAICAALSGADAELAQAFTARELSGEPIDQRWLDTLARLDPGTNGRIAELEQLMDKLEYSLMRFAQTTKMAQDETSDHRGALGAQIEAIADVAAPGGMVAELDRVVELSRAVLERIERVEQAMERSQDEARRLRASLATARMEADVDHLTRLPNRRAFERRLVSAASEARSKSEPLCIGFCDVDRFKQINDRYGHDAGDRVLCTIADTLSEHASDQCFVARHGGEEFVVLFYGLDKQAALAKLDSIRRAQAARRLRDRFTGQPFGQITFSAGIAEVTEDSDTRSALARADAALYQAKAAGRNRVVFI